MNTITFLGTRKRAIVGRFEKHIIVMQPITDADNRKFEEQKETIGEIRFNTLETDIPSEDVLFFGKLNFLSKHDKKLLKRFETRLWDPIDPSHFIYSNYDQNYGIAFKDKVDKIFKGYTCTDIVQWMRYCYLTIGKPGNIIVYKFSRGKFSNMCPKFFKEL